MHRTMIHSVLALAAVLLASLAIAGDVPTRNTVTNFSATAGTYTVPNFANGWLVKVQAYDTSGTNDTLTVAKIVPVTSTRSMTNTVAAIPLVANATYSLSASVTNEHLVPGDILRFTFGSVTGNVSITRLVSNP